MQSTADVVLVRCVKEMLKYPAPAKDLYVSPLFRRERSYAEASGAWQLSKVPRTELRAQLTAMRRQYSRRLRT